MRARTGATTAKIWSRSGASASATHGRSGPNAPRGARTREPNARRDVRRPVPARRRSASRAAPMRRPARSRDPWARRATRLAGTAMARVRRALTGAARGPTRSPATRAEARRAPRAPGVSRAGAATAEEEAAAAAADRHDRACDEYADARAPRGGSERRADTVSLFDGG